MRLRPAPGVSQNEVSYVKLFLSNNVPEKPMPAKIAIETLVIWPLYFLYVYLSTVLRGPVDAAFWYAQDIQDRLVELGLTTQVRITRRRKVTLLAGLVLMPAMLFVCVVIVNGARSYLQMLWQTYLLFMVAKIL